MSNTVIINLFIYKAYKYCYVDEKFHIEVSLSHENETCMAWILALNVGIVMCMH